MQRPDIIFFTCQMKYPGRNFFAVRRSNWWSYLKDTSLFPPQRQVGWTVPRTIVRGEHCQQAFLLLDFPTFNICQYIRSQPRKSYFHLSTMWGGTLIIQL